ncbi:DUF2913 family protein [Rahnella sp. BCC 1045]|uniref:DUF2913 family protein n=1 Tax=Rahnella sp. BCC 1045 TaxID=2816251 RepID=UPI001C269B82|nr:DUF2913 family protein [Rahnella sp. BCC 1045]MBU9819644.1 DUF2913 family protein [Rahnella sp. BCC 1045]
MEIDNAHIGHLAWCGLIALHLARKDGVAHSSSQENLYLIRWLAAAEKQKRFPKETADHIRWLLREGREKGVLADLPGKLTYLWRAGSGALLMQNDLFRLQHVLHATRLTGWVHNVLSEDEWGQRKLMNINPAVSSIYLNEYELETGFDSQGRQVKAFPVRVAGNIEGLDIVLQRAGWRRESVNNTQFLHYLWANVPKSP